MFHIYHMISKNGRRIPNQFVIQLDGGEVFQSYSTVIAFRPYDGKIKLNVDKWECSAQTSRHLSRFLRESKAETRRKIADGTYELVRFEIPHPLQRYKSTFEMMERRKL